MMSIDLCVAVILILFVSTFTRSSLGFGDAVIAMPLLALAIGIKAATPIVGLAAVTISLSIVSRNWRSVDLSVTWKLVLASLVGIPVGLLLLKGLSEPLMKSILGTIIVGYGIYQLVSPHLRLTGEHSILTFVVGFVAGILGGAYNANGILIAIYGTLRRWSPQRFRLTMQSYFFPTGFLIMVGHGVSGLWNRQVFTLYGLALPAILLAIYLGGKVNRSLRPGRFDRYVHGFLVIMGVLLIVRNIGC